MPDNEKDRFREMYDFLPEFFHKFLDPHREYVGEKVYRTTVFWTEMVIALLSALVYSWSNSFLVVVLTVIVFHIADFLFWYLDQNYINTNPMAGKIGRRRK